MASTIELFKAGKFKEENLIGENNFFRSDEEISEFNKKQEKFIADVDYSNPENFAKFGSAQEYYKNCINYINNYYPFDGSRTEKLQWVNDLNDFEYYIFNKEYPRYAGYLSLGSTQILKIYSPASYINKEAKESYNTTANYFSTSSFSFVDGFCFEGWIKIADTSLRDVFKVNTVISGNSGLSSETLFKIQAQNSTFYVVSGTTPTQLSTYYIPSSSWNHYAFNIKNGTIQFFVNGQLNTTSSLPVSDNRNYKFSTIGILTSSLFSSLTNTGSYSVTSTFEIGGNNAINVDEVRFWNEFKTIESIGRNWFAQINGNDPTDPENYNLIFYYKFNEGTSVNQQYCLDYSGFKCIGEVTNPSAQTFKISGSAINDSSVVQDNEIGDVIIDSLSNTGVLQDFYNNKLESGSAYDETNPHLLYNKFPSWVILQEQDENSYHLKQVIQIVSSYFDQVFNNIKEVSKLKHNKNTNDYQKLYPFYDKILNSTGFDVKDLFSNLDVIEKISSRNDNNLFDNDIQKIKNAIYQNIYNNLSYILKSKGTEKAIKTFLRSYGIDENLVRINLYADKSIYTITDKSKEIFVKKKTINLQDSSNIYLTGAALTDSWENITLENSLYFPKKHVDSSNAYSIMGLYTYNGSSESDWSSILTRYDVTLNNSSTGSQFYIFENNASIGYSPLIKDIYDNNVWNLTLKVKPNVDTIYGISNYDYKFEFSGINVNSPVTSSFNISKVITYANHTSLIKNQKLGYYLGANKTNLTGSLINSTNLTSLYCNLWKDYLSDEIIIEHNKDITNYGVDQ